MALLSRWTIFEPPNVLITLIQAWIDLRLLFLVCCVSPYIQGLCFPSKCKKPSFFLEIHSPILQEGNGPTRLMVICLAIAYWLSIMQNSKIFGSRMLHLQFWQSYQHNFSFSESKVTRFENDFNLSRFVVKNLVETSLLWAINMYFQLTLA